MSQITINVIDILHNSGTLKIKLFYKTFKDITTEWFYQKNIKGYCTYKSKKTDSLCLTKINEDKIKFINKFISRIPK